MVHGSFTSGEDAWIQQRELADSYRLLIVDRCGHGQSADTGRFGFEEQADDIAVLLGKSAHLVGSSYGAVLALIVAQREAARLGPDVAFSRFLERIGAEPLVSALTDIDRRNTAASFQEPSLLEAPVSLGGLSATRLPLLIVSGGSDAETPRFRNRRLAFQQVCARLATIPGAEWAQFANAGHNPHLEDPAFNPRLRAFLARHQGRSTDGASV